jgi:hypothetical protein
MFSFKALLEDIIPFEVLKIKHPFLLMLSSNHKFLTETYVRLPDLEIFLVSRKTFLFPSVYYNKTFILFFSADKEYPLIKPSRYNTSRKLIILLDFNTKTKPNFNL